MEAVTSVANGFCLSLHAIADPKGLEQIDDPSLLLVRHLDLACAARLVPASEYSDAPAEDAHNQLEWLTPRAMQHHEMLLKLMRVTPVVPLKFGTLCASVSDAEEMLICHYEKFLSLIELVRSREEWSVNVYVDKTSSLRRLEHSEPSLREFDEPTPARPKGEAYLLRKKKQKLANELLTARFATLEEELYSRIGHCAVAIRNLARSRSTATEPRHLLFSAAALIAQNGLADLKQELATIESDHFEDDLIAEICGPWPAYSFTNEELISD